MIDEMKFNIEEISGKTYDYIKCPHCMEPTLEKKYERPEAKEKEQKFKLSHCTSNNKTCPYQENIPAEKIEEQYGSPPKETKTDKLKKIRWGNVIATISVLILITYLIIQLI